MSIPSISPTADSNPSASTGKRKTGLNQEDFLNLFITQLRNQNPLQPMDNFQMAGQMAQFSSLESLNRIRSSLELMGAYQSSMNSLQAAGLLGKRVEIDGRSLSINGGKVSEGYYQLSKPGKVTTRIYDEKGQLVRTLEEGMKDGSRQTLTWNGKSEGGVTLPDGNYSFHVTAVDDKGQAIPVAFSRIETVTGIHFENGVIYLELGSERVTLRDVKAILNSSA